MICTRRSMRITLPVHVLRGLELRQYGHPLGAKYGLARRVGPEFAHGSRGITHIGLPDARRAVWLAMRADIAARLLNPTSELQHASSRRSDGGVQ